MNAFGKIHYILLAVAAAVAFLGMTMLTVGLESPVSLVGAPLVLFLAYIVLIPAAIFWPKSEKNNEGPSQNVRS